MNSESDNRQLKYDNITRLDVPHCVKTIVENRLRESVLLKIQESTLEITWILQIDKIIIAEM